MPVETEPAQFAEAWRCQRCGLAVTGDRSLHYVPGHERRFYSAAEMELEAAREKHRKPRRWRWRPLETPSEQQSAVA